MANITLGGKPVTTVGNLPEVGSHAPHFLLTGMDLRPVTSEDYHGKKKMVLNIFPSVDTGVCSASVRKFNENAASLDNTVVLCISMDLPFAMARFCGAEGIENVVMASGFRDGGKFGEDYGVMADTGGFAGLYSRAVVVVNEEGMVAYTEQVPEIGQEPNYEAALAAL